MIKYYIIKSRKKLIGLIVKGLEGKKIEILSLGIQISLGLDVSNISVSKLSFNMSTYYGYFPEQHWVEIQQSEVTYHSSGPSY